MFPFLTLEEEAVYKWQYRLHGDFKSRLFDAIMFADNNNLAKLHKAFPVEVDGYLLYTSHPGWWQQVEQKVHDAE